MRDGYARRPQTLPAEPATLHPLFEPQCSHAQDPHHHHRQPASTLRMSLVNAAKLEITACSTRAEGTSLVIIRAVGLSLSTSFTAVADVIEKRPWCTLRHARFSAYARHRRWVRGLKSVLGTNSPSVAATSPTSTPFSAVLFNRPHTALPYNPEHEAVPRLPRPASPAKRREDFWQLIGAGRLARANRASQRSGDAPVRSRNPCA